MHTDSHTLIRIFLKFIFIPIEITLETSLIYTLVKISNHLSSIWYSAVLYYFLMPLTLQYYQSWTKKLDFFQPKRSKHASIFLSQMYLFLYLVIVRILLNFNSSKKYKSFCLEESFSCHAAHAQYQDMTVFLALWLVFSFKSHSV